MGKAMAENSTTRWGALAQQAGKRQPVQVCQSRAGFYVGTLDEEGLPYSRESAEYWRDKIKAEQALDGGKWTQRTSP